MTTARHTLCPRLAVARNYICTWFLLDALTIFGPGAIDLSLASIDDDTVFYNATNSSSLTYSTSVPSYANNLKGLRTIRIVRLSKLIRLVRSSRIYRRWESRITVSSSVITSIQCALMLFVGAHW